MIAESGNATNAFCELSSAALTSSAFKKLRTKPAYDSGDGLTSTILRNAAAAPRKSAWRKSRRALARAASSVAGEFCAQDSDASATNKKDKNVLTIPERIC